MSSASQSGINDKDVITSEEINDMAGRIVQYRISNFIAQSRAADLAQQSSTPLDHNPYHDSFGRVRIDLPIVGTVPIRPNNGN